MQDIKRILLVDDQQSIRSAVKLSLLDLGLKYEIEEADNGADAIRLLATKKYDVAILDIQIPIRTGLEVAEFIEQRNIETPFLIFSSNCSKLNINKALRHQAAGIIEKDQEGIKSLKPALLNIFQGNYVLSSKVGRQVFRTRNIEEKENSNNLLTNRELEIIKLLCKEYTNKEMAEKMKISVRTVESHRKNIMSKLKLKTIAGLVKYAIEFELT